MKKITKKIICSMLTVFTLTTSVFLGCMPAYAKTVDITYGDLSDDGVITMEDAKKALEYVRRAELTDEVQAEILGLGLSATTAANAVHIAKKAKDPNYQLPKGDTTTIEVPDDPLTLPKTTLFILGDSTGCNYGPNDDKTYYYKRVGFGTAIGNYFNENVTVKNLALSGRSSKSFITEDYYQTYLKDIKSGDYVIIAFGHNDEKLEDATRGTAPGGTKETEGSFKKSLYDNYILPAINAGATPILATPIVRRTTTDGSWSNSSLHKTNGGDYSQDVIDLAKELDLTVIDNTTLTKNLYDELTAKESMYLHAWTSSKETSVDNTHLNNYGANYVSYMMANALRSTENKLGKYVKNNISAPDKKALLIVNPNYVEPSNEDVTGDDLISKYWKTTKQGDFNFYGTVFGDIGGDGKLHAVDSEGNRTGELSIESTTKKPFFDISENTDGSVHLRAGVLKDTMDAAATSVGKIAAASDGMAMYYTPADAGTNFAISGKIKINGFDKSNGQVAFGAIVSDSIKVDTYAAEGYPYVAASPLKLGNIGKVDETTGEALGANATYARIDGKLTNGSSKITEPIPLDSEVNVMITKKGNEFTVTYGDYTETYTLEMSGTVYAGFYVARCADITVSDIKFNNEISE